MKRRTVKDKQKKSVSKLPKRYSKIPLRHMRKVISYDHETGVLTWKVNISNSMPAGSTAGSLTAKGYINIIFQGMSYKAHRTAWVLFNSKQIRQGYEIDHVNGIKSDNRIANLRQVSHRTNLENLQHAVAGSETGVLGVTRCMSSKLNPYKTQIRANGKIKYLGVFPTKEDAHAAYLEAKRKFHAGYIEHC